MMSFNSHIGFSPKLVLIRKSILMIMTGDVFLNCYLLDDISNRVQQFDLRRA